MINYYLLKNKYFITSVIGVSLLLLFIIFLTNKPQRSQAEIIVSFFQTTEFENLLVTKLKFEDKIIDNYSKTYSSDSSDSYFDQAISWGKNSAFSVDAELHIVLTIIFKPLKDKVEIVEHDNLMLVKLLHPIIERIDVDYEKTIINFKKSGFLSKEPERELFFIHEVFNKNKTKYEKILVNRWISEARKVIKREVRRRLSEITELNEVVEVEFVN